MYYTPKNYEELKVNVNVALYQFASLHNKEYRIPQKIGVRLLIRFFVLR